VNRIRSPVLKRTPVFFHWKQKQTEIISLKVLQSSVPISECIFSCLSWIYLSLKYFSHILWFILRNIHIKVTESRGVVLCFEIRRSLVRISAHRPDVLHEIFVGFLNPPGTPQIRSRNCDGPKCTTVTRRDCALPQDRECRSPLAALPVLFYLLWARYE
jgi:hypothetical protein